MVRVRLDAELKSLVATATEQARAAGGDRAAETAKAAAAQELGLPMTDGHVMYPDAQLDIEDRDGMGGRGERGDRVRPLPRGGDRGEGRGRVCPCTAAADPPPGRSPARWRAKPTAGRAAAAVPAAMGPWSCRPCNQLPWPSG